MKYPELTNMALADLFGQLSTLIHSGIQLYDGLDILSEEEKDATFKALLSELSKKVEEGTAFSDALSEAGCFSAHVVGLLKMGESVGRFEETLDSLSRYYEDRERTSRQLKRAVTYPLVLLFMMAVVIVVLLTRVLPVFDNVYASLGGSLTGPAAALLALGGILNKALPYVGIVLGVVIIASALVLMIPAAREKAKMLWTLTRGDKGMYRKINNANFAEALSMAISSGMPLEEGVETAARLLSDNPRAKKRCEECLSKLEENGDLVAALSETELLPESACHILKIGLRVGEGDETMKKIAARLTEEAGEAMEERVAKIEPALVIFTTLAVGAILLSVMLPLINIMKVIG